MCPEKQLGQVEGTEEGHGSSVWHSSVHVRGLRGTSQSWLWYCPALALLAMGSMNLQIEDFYVYYLLSA